MTAAKPPLYLYLHLPFCREHCPYCDFYTIHEANPKSAARASYPALLVREVELMLAARPELAERELATIYLGGGTPSLYSPEELAPVLAAIRAVWRVAPDAEITMEANPGSLLLDRLGGYIDLGVNRVSLGVQTLHDDALRELGRAHDATDARRALAALAAEPRLRSWTADLIFGFPHQTPDHLLADLRAFVEAGAPHVSVYGLTLHSGTPYEDRWRRGDLPLPDEDAVLEMFRATRRELRAAGLEAYEFSNFARPGHRAVHNAAYWSLDDVVPLGVSACGYLDGRRLANPRSLDRWRAAIESDELALEVEEPLTGRKRAGELLMCALRQEQGATWEWLAARCGGEDLCALYATEIETARQAGWLDETCLGERLRLSEAGIELSDEFFATLF